MRELKEVFDKNIAEIKNLDGDINYSNIKYALTDDVGKKYILKIFPDIDELALAKEESRIFNEIGGKLSFKVPQNINTPDGDPFFAHEKGTAKLLDFIDGVFISEIEQSASLLFSLGEKAAELDIELLKINSPLIASRRLFWDVQNAHLSLPKVDLIKETERRKLALYFLDRFQQFAFPHLHELRHQIIHGDLNDNNILVKAGEIEGFLDFGDSSYGPMVTEIAVAMTYLMFDKEDPFNDILPLLQGYHSANPLTPQEIELLPEFITTRLCISLCNSAEKKHLGQDNGYVLISENPAWNLLEKWITTNPNKIKNTFLKAAGFEPIDHELSKNERHQSRTRIAGRSLTLSYDVPIHMSSAAFQYMYDESENTYLDACNNISHVGHSHPEVSRAISNQIRRLNTNTRYVYEPFSKYGDRLLKHFPDKLSKIFFVNSGSEANDLAIRMARTYTGRHTVAVVEHGYHGNSSLGIEISSYKFDGKGGAGSSSNILKLPLPNLFSGKFSTGKEYAVDAIDRLERHATDPPAVFIAEPISGCGGQVPLAQGYLADLYGYLNANRIVTISDEVQTGFGRLGGWFWGFEMHGVVPDIVVLGKPMGNGHPIAAVITTPGIADSFANGMEFFSSFGGNPVSCEAANAVLDVIEKENLQSNAKEVGAFFKSQLLRLKEKYSCIADVRGEGLFLGIEFLSADGVPDKEKAILVRNELKNAFILTGTDGPHENVIKIKPPLCFNTNNVEEFVTKLDRILKKNGS